MVFCRLGDGLRIWDGRYHQPFGKCLIPKGEKKRQKQGRAELKRHTQSMSQRKPETCIPEGTWRQRSSQTNNIKRESTQRDNGQREWQKAQQWQAREPVDGGVKRWTGDTLRGGLRKCRNARARLRGRRGGKIQRKRSTHKLNMDIKEKQIQRQKDRKTSEEINRERKGPSDRDNKRERER